MLRKELTVPSTLEQIRRVSDEILNALAAYSVSETALFNIKLCIEEAVRNAIVHGNKLQEGRSVRVAYQVDDNELVIEVEDEGSGFSIKNLPDPTKDENLLKESGRSVFLILNLMDRAEYNERGNKVTMAKVLSGGDNGSQDGK